MELSKVSMVQYNESNNLMNTFLLELREFALAILIFQEYINQDYETNKSACVYSEQTYVSIHAHIRISTCFWHYTHFSDVFAKNPSFCTIYHSSDTDVSLKITLMKIQRFVATTILAELFREKATFCILARRFSDWICETNEINLI